MNTRILNRFLGLACLAMLVFFAVTVTQSNAAGYIKIGDIKGESIDKTAGDTECESCIKIRGDRDELATRVKNKEAEIEAMKARDGITEAYLIEQLELGDLQTALQIVEKELLKCREENCPVPIDGDPDRPIIAPILESCQQCENLHAEIQELRREIRIPGYKDIDFPTDTSGSALLAMNKADLVEKLANKLIEYAENCQPGENRRNLCQYDENEWDFVCRLCDPEIDTDLEELDKLIDNPDDEKNLENLKALRERLEDENSSCWVRCKQIPVEPIEPIRPEPLPPIVVDGCKECYVIQDEIHRMESRKFQTLSNVSKMTDEEERELSDLRNKYQECRRECIAVLDDPCPDCSIIRDEMRRYKDIIQKMEISGVELAQIELELDYEKASPKGTVPLGDDLTEEGALMLEKLRNIEREYYNLAERYAKCIMKRKRADSCSVPSDVDCPSCKEGVERIGELEARLQSLGLLLKAQMQEVAQNALVAALPSLTFGATESQLLAEEVSFTYQKIIWTYKQLDQAYQSYRACLRVSSNMAETGVCSLTGSEAAGDVVGTPYCPDCEQMAEEWGRIKVRFPKMDATDSADATYKTYSGAASHDTAMNVIRKIGAAYSENGLYESCLRHRNYLQEHDFCGGIVETEHEELKERCPRCHRIAKELQELLDKRFYLMERGHTDDLKEVNEAIAKLKRYYAACLKKSRAGVCKDERPDQAPKPFDIQSADRGDFSADSFFDVFTDLGEDNHNADAIAFLSRERVVEGYGDGSFGPKKEVNRAEFAKMATEAAGIDPNVNIYKNCFPDVTEEWFARYVCYGVEKGWLKGYPDGMFHPARPINKVEALKIIFEFFGLGAELSEVIGDSSFDDIDPDAWYALYLQFAEKNDILDDIDSKFFPGKNMTRGGMSELLYRLMVLLHSGELVFD